MHSIAADSTAENPRVLLLVTTKRDGEITQRLFSEVGLTACLCETVRTLEEPNWSVEPPQS